VSLLRLAIVGAGALALAACNSGAPEPEAEETEIPDDVADASQPLVEVDDSLGTPLEERVATLGLINKRNNITRDIELRPGEQQRFDNIIIRLASCERTAPWENPPLTGAFVQVLVQDRGANDWKRIFSGWLYKEAPAVNVVEHPIYDVWVKDCAMSFPGEETAVSSSGSAPAATPAPEAATPATPATEAAPAPASANN
jgi:hypothetical protein